jgi:hypothetical protein
VPSLILLLHKSIGKYDPKPSDIPRLACVQISPCPCDWHGWSHASQRIHHTMQMLLLRSDQVTSVIMYYTHHHILLTIPAPVGISSRMHTTGISLDIVVNWSLWFSRMCESHCRVRRSCSFGWRSKHLAPCAITWPRLSILLPRCGVPRKITPLKWAYIFPSGGWRPWLSYVADLINASLITSPPRLWPTKIIGRVCML